MQKWQLDTSKFTNAVNTSFEVPVPVMTQQAFCNSALPSGHLLIDLFGLSKAHCQAVMVHYKLLKLQHPTLSAHVIVPTVNHMFEPALCKPVGLMMQTCQQFSRGRRKADVLYNPPVLQRRDIAVPDSAGLSNVFEVRVAGTPARVLVDTGAEAPFVDTLFANRTGIHIQTSSASAPQIQLANGSHIPTAGQVSVSMQMLEYRNTLHAIAADLSQLPCDILLGDDWMRLHSGSITFGLKGATGLQFKKGNKNYAEAPAHTAISSHYHSA